MNVSRNPVAATNPDEERRPLTAAEALRGVVVPVFPLFPHEFHKPKESATDGKR